jgi:hypothetical protein
LIELFNFKKGEYINFSAFKDDGERKVKEQPVQPSPIDDDIPF